MSGLKIANHRDKSLLSWLIVRGFVFIDMLLSSDEAAIDDQRCAGCELRGIGGEI
jgi:hypothetical protein